MRNLNSRSDSVPATQSVCIVRWVLQTGRASIACEIDMNHDRSFDLRVTPSWQRGSTFVERFAQAVPAMKKHAQITSTLRELGWEVTDRTGDLHAAA